LDYTRVTAPRRPLIRRMRAFYALTKPRVMSLIVCTAVRMSGWLHLAAALFAAPLVDHYLA